MATTPCPHCAAEVPVPEEERSVCPGCGQPLRFIDVPETACTACGGSLAVPPGQEVLRCPCGNWQAAQEDRGVRFVATCPRCRRRIEVPSDAATHTCPHCGASMAFHDTL